MCGVVRTQIIATFDEQNPLQDRWRPPARVPHPRSRRKPRLQNPPTAMLPITQSASAKTQSSTWKLRRMISPDIHDTEGLQQETARAVAFGFGAKAAIHPGQVAAINAALTPTQEAVKQARAILAVNAKGVGTVGGQMIDEAVARKARRTLAAAGLAA